jgi:serine/threonine protein kinase
MAKAPNVEKSMTPELWETPEGWERLKPLLHPAMQKPPEERARFVDEVCGDDLELRDALLRLLRANEDSIGRGDGPIVRLHSLFPLSQAAFAEGELVANQFRIVRLIGSGGMGEVYEAIDLELGRRIALKTIRPDIAGNPQMLAHFKKEVLLAQRISGPHVCRIHALHPPTDSRAGTRQTFLTMEYLDGMTLADKIRESGPLPWSEVKTIALGICEGLRVMHEAGIIHRDLKSRNVMLAQRNGVVHAVVMDFGLAHEVRSATSETETDVSAEQGVAGTIDYMAPEQFAGDPLTPAADIFALGVVMYELATGQHPFPSRTILQAAIRRGHRPPAPSSIQKGLPHRCDEIVCRCLEFEPKKRYGSVKEVAEALTASPATLPNIRSDHPWAFRFACGLILAATAWGVVQLWQWWRYDKPNATATRWYDQGVTALREGSYVKSTRLLTAAIGSESHFAMAHARLAEAWANLDFDGRSTQELINALGGEHHLRPLDSLYLSAIHATLTRDYASAVLFYKKILSRLPADKTQTAAGYVDLGMAYERGGDPTHAHESFMKSEGLDGDNPAAYMQEAILDTRLHKVEEANSAFNKAEAIFAREMNQEGLAELDYERGYEANVEGDSERANFFLNRSLAKAREIENVQLEIRVLTQLSSVACASGHAEDAVNLAQRAIDRARAHQLDTWAAMGLARLANARYVEGPQHYSEAENAINEALSLAKDSRQGRAEALANVTLAGLRDQQHRWNEVIVPATAALKYYEQNGYFEPAANATLLILRANERRGDFQDTLRAANEFRNLAEKSGSRDLLMQAEGELGTTLRAAERYPDALPHFQRALALADDQTNRAYLAVSQAENLVRLGRFVDAEALLQPSAKVESVAADVGGVRLDGLLYQEKYSQALSLANDLISGHPDMVNELRGEIEYERAITEAHLQRKSDALRHLDGAAHLENETDPAERWALALQAAEIKVFCGRIEEGRDDATSAEAYFASRSELDSELHAALLAVTASKLLHDDQNSAKYSAKGIDILSSLEHNWGPREFHSYISRPDVVTLTRVLPPVAPLKGDGIQRP